MFILAALQKKISQIVINLYSTSTNNGTLVKRDIDTYAVLWSKLHGDLVRGIDIDKDKNVIIAGRGLGTAGGANVRKYDKDGTLLWSKNLSAEQYQPSVDTSGSVYTTGDRVSNLTTRKYDKDGNLLWSRDFGASTYGTAIDKFNNVYVGGIRTSNVTLRKYDTDGTLIWSKDHGGSNCRSVSCKNDLVIAGHQAAVGGVDIRVYDLDGNNTVNALHGNLVWGSGQDDDGNIYINGDPASSNITRKYNSSGVLQWSRTGSYGLSTVGYYNGKIYVAGFASSGNSIRVYDVNGTLLISLNNTQSSDTWGLQVK